MHIKTKFISCLLSALLVYPTDSCVHHCVLFELSFWWNCLGEMGCGVCLGFF